MAAPEIKSSPHNDLRVIEAKLRELNIGVKSDDPVWASLDRLWEYVVKGGNA